MVYGSEAWGNGNGVCKREEKRRLEVDKDLYKQNISDGLEV